MTRRDFDKVIGVYYSERPDDITSIWTIIPEFDFELEMKIAEEQMEIRAKYPFKLDFRVIPSYGKDEKLLIPPNWQKLYPD